MNITNQLSRWQQDFLNRFNDDFVIACTAISAGKTRIVAIWTILQCIKKPGIRGIVIAQTYKSLDLVLMRELKKICAGWKISYRLNNSKMEMTFSNGSVLYGFSNENPDAVLGLTEISLLVIDEASYCCREIYDNARDRMRCGKYSPVVRLISSPNNGESSNYFIELCKKYPDKLIKATAFDNPFTPKKFKDELKERYIEGSNIYKQQVLGEILDTDAADALIRLDDFIKVRPNINSDNYYLGIDASGTGKDNWCIVLRNDNEIVNISKINMADTSKILSHVMKIEDRYALKSISIDISGGYGNSIFEALLRTRKNVIGINFGEKASDSIYSNIRTEMYSELSKAIREGFYINDNELIEELRAQRVYINDYGRLCLKKKQFVKEIIGRSPDIADALALTFNKKEFSSPIISDYRFLENLDTI